MAEGRYHVAVDAVVVAAGRSTRMGGIDKLTASIGGRPLLAWTLDAFAATPGVERIVVVAAADRAQALGAEPWLPSQVVAVVAGGPRRQESVHAGVARLDPGERPEERVVLVHDGARPLVSPALVTAVAAAAADHGAAIPVTPVVETLKRVAGGFVGETVDRDGVVAAQTPQGVRRDLLERAWLQYPPAATDTFTDEAALLEACRIPVHAIPGQPSNLKVTLPDDLRRAELALLGTAPPRIGFGEDSHPFGDRIGLALGGVTIDDAPQLHGHSDGDVALHAVADALLGAAGLGDLGRLFPADARTPPRIASRELLAEVVRRVDQAGFRASSLDLTIVGARPRLGDRLETMAREIAAIVALPGPSVSVKASSGNLIGPEGAGRAITARAVALVERKP
jgi:2-C-methyl-D-erythritol 4-phosphate cytidylyltransferase/2-C-methyl-D-erythritol 2,4-cyclodiphosphate synthase